MDTPQSLYSTGAATRLDGGSDPGPDGPVVAVDNAGGAPLARPLGLTLLGVVVAVWPTVSSFPPTWNASYQEHGFFVGGLVLWLLWRNRRRVLHEADEGIPDLLPVVGLISLSWLFAVIMNVRLIHQLLFWALATIGALTIFGWRARRPILVTAATFLLAIPFWSLATPVLQRLTTIMSGAIARAGGVEAVIREDTISISTGTFLVESGCSGINYLMGGLVLGAFYAHLFTDRWQTQAKIVAVAGAFSIVGNWIRVAALVFLGEATAMQSPYIEDHLWQGWAIFTLLMIPTYFVARRIEERDARTQAAEAEAPTPKGDVSTPVVSPALMGRARRTALAAVAGPILFYAVGVLPTGGDPDLDPGVFGVADDWEAVAEPAPWTPDFGGFDARADWVVRSPDGTLQGTRLLFADQQQGEELIQYNNRIAPDSLVAASRIIGPVGVSRRFVHETVVRDADVPRVVWHWYRVAGFDTPFESKAKLLEILAFFRRSPAAELVVLSAGCAPDDCTDAARTLRAAFGVTMDPTPSAGDPDPGEGDSGAGEGDPAIGEGDPAPGEADPARG